MAALPTKRRLYPEEAAGTRSPFDRRPVNSACCFSITNFSGEFNRGKTNPTDKNGENSANSDSGVSLPDAGPAVSCKSNGVFTKEVSANGVNYLVADW